MDSMMGRDIIQRTTEQFINDNSRIFFSQIITGTMSNPNLTSCNNLSVSANASVGGNLSTNGSVSCNSLSATGIVSCSGLNSLTTTNLNSLDTTSSVSMQFAQHTSDIMTNNISISNIQTKNSQQDDSLTSLGSRMTTAETSLAAHQTVNDTQNGRLTTNEGNISALLTTTASHTTSIASINSKDTSQDSSISSLQSSVSSLTSHQSSQDTSISSNTSNISSNTSNISALQTKTQRLSYDSSDSSTVISRAGSINNATLKLTDTGTKALYFLPNATDNAYNYLVEANDSEIAFSDCLSIVPDINDTTGLRITKTSAVLSATGSQPIYGADNAIKFDATARTVELVSPNWITSNQALVAPDFRLSSTNESISNIIGDLRTADTTINENLGDLYTIASQESSDRANADSALGALISTNTSNIATNTSSINALNTKTSLLTNSSGESHFSSNVVLDNASALYVNRTSNYTAPFLYCNTQPLYVVKAMVSFYMSSSGNVQLMNGGSKTSGYSIARDSQGVYLLTLPAATVSTITSFSNGLGSYYASSAQLCCAQANLCKNWTVQTGNSSGNSVIAIFLYSGGDSTLSDLPIFQTNQYCHITVFVY
jgi:hypothetical protein